MKKKNWEEIYKEAEKITDDGVYFEKTASNHLELNELQIIRQG